MSFIAHVQQPGLLQLYQQPAGDAVTQVDGLTHLESLIFGALKGFAILPLKSIPVYIERINKYQSSLLNLFVYILQHMAQFSEMGHCEAKEAGFSVCFFVDYK